MTNALLSAPDDPFFPLGALTPTEKQFLGNVPRAYCAQASTTRGTVPRGSMPRLVFLFPGDPSRPNGRAACAEVRRRSPEEDCAGRGDRGKERRPRGHSAAGAGGAASSRAPAARQDKPGQRSQRQGESARPPARSLPRSPARPVLCSWPAGTAAFPPDGARGPQLSRMPPPAPTPSRPPPPRHPLPSPRPPTPHRNGKYLPGRGAGGATPL